MTYSDLFSYNIGILGPSGIGKTSLLTAIILETQLFQKKNGFQFSLYPSDQETADKIAAARKQFDRAVALSEFTPIPGSAESSKFEVRLDMQSGETGESLDVDFIDYRGGDLLKDIRQIESAEWFRKMVKSRDLFVPIDAVAIMEYAKTGEQGILESLGLERIEEIIRMWVDNMDESSPYTIAFAPIKVETYTVNGTMEGLRNAIHTLYYEKLKHILDEKPNLIVQYNPVETYGCVMLESAEWKPPTLIQKFRILRRNEDEEVVPRIRGASSLMLAIFRKRLNANLKRFETRIKELNLKLDSKYALVKKLIDMLPFVHRTTKRELSDIIAKKEYYEGIIGKMMDAFESASVETWKEMK